VEPEVFFIQLRALGDSFQTVQKIELRIAAGSRENQATGLVGLRFSRLQTFTSFEGIGISRSV
jgi:hypothetical protein